MLNRLFLGVLVCLGIVILVGLRLPAQFETQRSILVGQTAPALFTLLSQLERFPEWSPLQQRDEEVSYETRVIQPGPGAKIAWRGNEHRVGRGTLEILGVIPDRLIEMEMVVYDQGLAGSWIELQPVGERTRVTWGLRMDTRRNDGWLSSLLGRYFGLLFDTWAGPDLERGLASIRAIAESAHDVNGPGASIEWVDIAPVPVIFVSGQTSQDSSDIAAATSEAFAEIFRFLSTTEGKRNGYPLVITRGWDERGFLFDAAVPVSGELPPLSGRLQSGMSPGGRVLRMEHTGPYSEILESYRVLEQYMLARGIAAEGVSWEEYPTNPASTPLEESTTVIYVRMAR